MQLKKQFRFRNIWLGAAMLWVMLFHSDISLNPPALNYLKYFGYGGVDICLFASGIGCYYSLDKNPDILGFLKRRLIRLGPVYLCFMVPWLVWKFAAFQFPLHAVLGNLLGIQSLVSWEYHFNWYIGGLVIFYLSLPYFKAITDSFDSFRKDFAMLLFLLLVSIPFWQGSGNSLVFLSRLPILYLGVVCAKMAKAGFHLRISHCFVLLILMCAGMNFLYWGIGRIPEEMTTNGFYWYPFVLIAPGCCLCLSIAANYFERFSSLRWINKLLETIGLYSFEVYLIHIFVFEEFMTELCKRFSGIPNNLLWLMTIPIITLGCFVLNRAAYWMTNSLKKYSKKA